MNVSYQHYINGQFVPSVSGETFESINPFDQSVVGTFARGQKADVDKAVAAARKAFDEGPWPRMTGEERALYLTKLSDALAEKTKELMPKEIADSGSTYRKAQGDFYLGVNQLKYFAKLTGMPIETDITELTRAGVSHNTLVYEPLGVCGQIIPWNFPIMMAIWKLGPALGAGCTVVLKPAEETPLSAMEIAKLCDSIGFPPGVINIVTGYGHEAGAALVNHPGVDKIGFTGSTEIGRQIMCQAGESMKRVTLECGGKSANILLDDADPSIAIDGSLYAIYFHTGQCCTAGSRLLIPESRKAEWLEALVEKTRGITLGNPADKATEMGPLVSKKQQERVLGYIAKGQQEGAKLLTGGKAPTDSALANGCFVEPTIFDGVTNAMTIAQEEIFGPVLSIITYKTVEEAIQIANDSQYGLAAGVWGQDKDRNRKVARQLRAGTVWVNEYHLISEKAPFGGYKQSGLGRELGANALNSYREVKHIYEDELGSREKKFWYDVVIKPTSLVNA